MSDTVNPETPEPPPPTSEPETPAVDGPAAESATTLSEVKRLTQVLLRQGFIESARHDADFRRAVTRQAAINTALEPLDLCLQLDEERGIAFLRVAETNIDETDETGEWSHLLVRRQRLTLEQSILVAILRERFVLHEQEAGIGSLPPRVAVEELLPQFLTYFGDSGSDAKNESRIANLLDQLKTYGIVTEVDKNEEIAIRPLIAHLANPETLANLLDVLEDQARETK